MGLNRLNILIYSGPGVSGQSVIHLQNLFKRLLNHHYAVQLITPAQLQTEPWLKYAALLVIPGGQDLRFHQTCRGSIAARIREYLTNFGGRYLGWGGGAYYASRHVEFDQGGDNQILGDRDLDFFPGTCRGPVKFEEGAERQVRFEGDIEESLVKVKLISADGSLHDQVVEMIGTGGAGTFVGAYDMPQSTKVLAEYCQPAISSGCGKGLPAVILCQVGTHSDAANENNHNNGEAGLALLSGVLPHPTDNDAMVRYWLENELNLQCNSPSDPELLHLTRLLMFNNPSTSEFTTDGSFSDTNNQFTISSSIEEDPFLPNLDPSGNALQLINCHQFVSYERRDRIPALNPPQYFQHRKELGGELSLGNTLWYGEVVTSTQTILHSNPKLLECVPRGLVLVGGKQVAGKGRGKNAWVSPPGCLQFSLYLTHPVVSKCSVVLLQYLVSLSIIEAVHNKPGGYSQLPLRLKWPNDLYGLSDPTDNQSLRKLGGILVNSSLNSKTNQYQLIVGMGINLSNSEPTLCINDLAKGHGLPPLSPEDLLARILHQLQINYNQFITLNDGFHPFLDRYYSHWLHTNQLVTLTDQDNQLARVTGITPDFGMLDVISVNPKTLNFDPLTAKSFHLQPDGNSFDMMTGFISKKVYPV